VGRPAKSAPPKREAILDAAWRVFLRYGYGAATMDEVAATAGVSKRTVYDHFMSKEGLFGAIIRRRRDEMLQGLATEELDERDPQAALTRFAARHLGMVMSKPVLELYRVVLAEAPRLPDPARIMFEAGLDRVAERLAAYLAGLMKRGTLRAGDPKRCAEAFVGLLAGYPTTQALLGVRARGAARQLSIQVALAVRIFLEGCRATRSRAMRR
jgi:TetR/AcrR family transcriptional regulator, mexJK operon transcriptional repressor